MQPPKHLLCLATQKGYAVLESLKKHDPNQFVVCSFAEKSMASSAYDSIRRLSQELGIFYLDWADLKRNFAQMVGKHRIERALCVSWRYLFPKTIREQLNQNVFIIHDSLLPKYRGFNPLVSALINGDSQTGITLFRASNEVDAGNILWQESIPISQTDTIASLTQKCLPLYQQAVQTLLTEPMPKEKPQNESQATYSVWRDNEDYFLDWSQNAKTIARYVRAMGFPYLGAKTKWEGKIIRIDQARALPEKNFPIRQPGKIWNISPKGEPEIICGEGLLRIERASFEDKPLLPWKILRTRFAS